MSTTQAQQVLTFTSRFTTLVTTAVNCMLEELAKLAKESKEYQLLSNFKDYVQEHMMDEGALDFTVCRSYAYSDFQNSLTESDIPCQFFVDKEIGAVIMASRPEDREVIRDVKNKMFEQQRKMSRVSINELNRMNSNSFIEKINGLTPEQVKVFQEYAHNAPKGFVMAAEKNKNGTYTVSYAQKDKTSARMAMLKVAESTVGVSGQFQTQRITKELKRKDEIVDKLNKNDDFYIVSGINPREYIHVNHEGFDHRRGDKYVRTESRRDERFRGMLYNQMMGIVKPVVLLKDEYEKNSDINSYVKGKLERQPMTADEKHKAYLESRARMLVEAKLSLDNGNQPENISSFYNDECSFSEFFAHEVVNDEHDEEIRRASLELDEVKEDDKSFARDYIKNVYSEMNVYRTETELVTPDKIAQDLESFINEHDSDAELGQELFDREL